MRNARAALLLVSRCCAKARSRRGNDERGSLRSALTDLLAASETAGAVSNERERDQGATKERDRPSAQVLLERALEDLRTQQVELELREAELRRAAERQQLLARSYSTLFELSPAALLEVNGIGGVGRCNRLALSALPGVQPGILLTELPIPASVREQLLNVVLSAQRKGRAAGLLELGSRCYGVEAVHVASGGEPRTLLFLSDATEQLAARRAAERAAEQLRAIVRVCRDGAALLHDAEVLYANEAWRSLTGAAELSGPALLDVPIEGRALGRHLAELAANDGHRALEVRLGEHDGQEVVLELTALPVEYEGRACMLVMARDLSARRRLEAQMSRNERLASLGMLVASVAHEINNPLTYTLGNLESLAARLESAPMSASVAEAGEVVRDAIDGCQRIAAIVRELRSFHRSDAHEVTSLDPNQVVRDAVRIVAPKCAALARLELDLDDVPAVRGVQTSLGQVLINLIVNAVDAMAEGDTRRNVVRISTSCRGRDVRIEVADNGPGIAAEHLPRIFEPFFSQGKPGGTGLGLTISRNLVEQMNGWLDVDSQLGTGSRFIVHLEACESLLESTQPPPLTTAILADARILVVDDEPMVARSVARLLASAREVVCAHSVASALDCLTTRLDIDLVISDWVMPDGGASVLIRELRAHGLADLPVVIMTGLGQLTAGQPQGRPCVPKPVSRSALLATVSDELAMAQQRRSMIVRLDPSQSAAFRLSTMLDAPRPDVARRRS